MKRAHSHFRGIVASRLKENGYRIIDQEVVLKDIIINGTYIIVDLLVEKDGKIIPVECGHIQHPKHERIIKLKEKFGNFMHVRYGFDKRRILHNRTVF